MMNIGLSGTMGFWVLGLSAWALLSLILIIGVFVSNSKLRRRIRHWQSIHQTADLEKVYEDTKERIEEFSRVLQGLDGRISGLDKKIKTKVSTARIKRYNAFAETGSDLSFSVALLDDYNSGVVLSSIYGREESRTYAKPIQTGRSNYALTDEEMEVVTGVEQDAKGHQSKRVPQMV